MCGAVVIVGDVAADDLEGAVAVEVGGGGVVAGVVRVGGPAAGADAVVVPLDLSVEAVDDGVAQEHLGGAVGVEVSDGGRGLTALDAVVGGAPEQGAVVVEGDQVAESAGL